MNAKPKHKIAYAVGRFPSLPETFILNEMLVVRDEGFDIDIYPVLNERQELVHPGADELIPRTRYIPFFPTWRMICAHAYFAARHPGRYFSTMLGVPWGMKRSRDFFIKTLALLPKAVLLARIAQKSGIEHIHAQWATHPTTMAYVIHRLTGITYSITAHAHDLYVDTTMLGPKFASASFIVTISNYNVGYITERWPKETEGKVVLLRTGANLQRFAGRQRKGHAGPFTIVSVGRVTQMKGFRYLVEAARILSEQGRDFQVRVAGDGDDMPYVKAKIDEYGLADRFVMEGAVNHDRVVELLYDGDCFVLPSVVLEDGLMEGIPVALMEAMAVRLPVVTTATSGIPELVENEHTGLLVPQRDPDALAAAIGRLMDDTELGRRLGDAARRRIEEEFDMAANARKLAELIRRQIETGKALE